MRHLLSVFLLLALLPSVRAAGKPGEPIRLAVSPAAAPAPPLKYRLYPDRRDLKPGNAATLYYRAMASFYENAGLLKEIHEQYWSDWLETPPKDLPMEQVREKLALARRLLHEFDVASQYRDCDWQIEDRPEGVGLLLPEVQGFRSIGVVLAVRARYEIALGKWDDACRSLQTGYALAHHLGVGPTMIHVLVGGAVAALMDKQAEAMIQQPGAPNLYWALTELLRPFLDPELSVEQESRMIDRMIPWVKRLDGPPMSDAEVQTAAEEMREWTDAFVHDLHIVEPTAMQKVAQAFFLVQGAGEARRGLLARGKYTAEQLDAMPAFQATGLYAYLEYRDSLDQLLLWVRAPHGLHHPGFQKASERYQHALVRLDRLFFRGVLVQLFGVGESAGDSYAKVYDAAGRADRRIAGLECVEALRMTAARDGKWPETLEGVTDVPLPDDPMTGKPFEYRVRDNEAALTAPGKAGDVNALSYEVFLRK